MKDVLELLYWLRAVWETRSELARGVAICPLAEWDGFTHGLEFFTLWVTDLLHVGRTYETD